MLLVIAVVLQTDQRSDVTPQNLSAGQINLAPDATHGTCHNGVGYGDELGLRL